MPANWHFTSSQLRGNLLGGAGEEGLREVLGGEVAMGGGLVRKCLGLLEDGRYWGHSHRTTQAMSEEQLTALLAKIKEDAGLQEKLEGAADLDAAMAIAKEAGFDLSNADWLKYQAEQPFELSEEELEGVAGGVGGRGFHSAANDAPTNCINN